VTKEVTDQKALRPKTARLRTFEQAAAATDELFALEHDSNAADDAESDEEGPTRGNQVEADEPVEELDELEPEHQSDQVEDEDQDQDQEVVLIRDSKKDEIDEEAAADFDREFAKMMADTTDARRGDSRRAPPPVFDTAIPHVKKREEREAAEGRMSFTLLSKRGNRQQVSLVTRSLITWLMDRCVHLISLWIRTSPSTCRTINSRVWQRGSS
jgi:regulator of nonsense transcripts 2